MNRFAQLHLLTFYPPSNLNRDDTGKPKTAIVGGATRLRISSQALKRAWRTSDIFRVSLGDGKCGDEERDRMIGHLGTRTPHLARELFERLEKGGIEKSIAHKTAIDIADAFGNQDDEKKKKNPDSLVMSQVVFISPQEYRLACDLADEFIAGNRAPLKTGEAARKLLALKNMTNAADIAMFGRMLTDMTKEGKTLQQRADSSLEAAIQVAHAITTHKVAVDDDYFTAMDDLKRPSDDMGAGFIGEAGFGAGVFYLYINIDRALLLKNLGGDADVAKKAIGALITAAAKIGPRGKSASFASFARAAHILAERGDAAPRTLAGAFLHPVDNARDDQHRMIAREEGYLKASVDLLHETRARFEKVYGGEGVASRTMDAASGEGSLQEIIAFAIEGL
jgi:CRISPR system Cascade subunit CasC